MRLSSVGIPVFSLCDSCKFRDLCSKRNDAIVECTKEYQCLGRVKQIATKGREMFYDQDDDAIAANAEEIVKARLALLKSLKVTDSDQIIWLKSGEITYHPKPEAVRKKNSRAWKKVRIDDLSYSGHCENCGRKFITVNYARKLCNRCWEEICCKLQVSYGLMSAHNKTVTGGEE